MIFYRVPADVSADAVHLDQCFRSHHQTRPHGIDFKRLPRLSRIIRHGTVRNDIKREINFAFDISANPESDRVDFAQIGLPNMTSHQCPSQSRIVLIGKMRDKSRTSQSRGIRF